MGGVIERLGRWEHRPGRLEAMLLLAEAVFLPTHDVALRAEAMRLRLPLAMLPTEAVLVSHGQSRDKSRPCDANAFRFVTDFSSAYR